MIVFFIMSLLVWLAVIMTLKYVMNAFEKLELEEERIWNDGYNAGWLDRDDDVKSSHIHMPHNDPDNS